MRTFLLSPTAYGDGLTSASLGMVRALQKRSLRVGFFKPISQPSPSDKKSDNTHVDKSSYFIQSVTGFTPPKSIELEHAQQLLSDGKRSDLMEEVVRLFQQIEDVDVVVVEGLVPTRSLPYSDQINASLASALDASVLIVAAPGDDDSHAFQDRIEIAANLLGGAKSKKVLGVVINKIDKPNEYRIVNAMDEELQEHTLQSPEEILEQLLKKHTFLADNHLPVAGAIPWTPELLSPRTSEIAKYLGATWVNEGVSTQRRMKSISICARTVPNIARVLRSGELLVMPGDREDLFLAACMAALNGVPLAGILLTGSLLPDEKILQLCRNALETGLPVMSVPSNSFGTATALTRMDLEVPIDDRERIENVMDTFSNFIDGKWLQAQSKLEKELRMSPPAFRYQLIKRAAKANKRIVLPEGDEPRTVQAAIICHQKGIAKCVLLAKRDAVQRVAQAQGLELPDDIEIIDPASAIQQYIEPMVELRKSKGLTAPMAEAQLADTVVLGTMMLALDEVDGLVSGAVHTTANTIRPAFQLIKTRKDVAIASSVFFMLLPDNVVVYGDCAINPDPTAEQLASIAIQSAESARSFGIEPRVAMISYSTGTSGAGSEVEKVSEATKIAKQLAPDLMIDGPLQYDAAAIASVAKKKAPDSPVAGQATVFIFPDLNTGNTTYKAVQRSANVVSIGPMLQGLNKPVNDLSRGALVDDIVYTIALTAIQANG
ncbi:phosphate acetyltransferase [Leucothrix sargassi]|nr:phosphate acetyltransferase [Leucothrix sargassi]